MKNALTALALSLGILVLGFPAYAAVENGFGLYGGLASHTTDGVFTSGPTGTRFEFTSSGLSIGVDYQFAIGDSSSISPFLVSSSESFSEKSNIFVENDGGGHGILGVQFRLWIEDMFVGGHVGRYTELIQFQAGNATADGPGFGVVAGWEGEKNLFFSIQYDQATLDGGDVEIDLTGIRLHAGYRWK